MSDNLEMQIAVLREQIKQLEASNTAWKIIAKQNGQLAELTPTEQCKMLTRALESSTKDLCDAWETIEKLMAENERLKRKFAIQ